MLQNRTYYVLPTRTFLFVANIYEPGYYKTGGYGIRIENLVVVKETESHPEFLGFETLTLAPIDQRLILTSLLSESEKSWINQYHKKVYERLESTLSEGVRIWLEETCMPLDCNY